MSQHLEFAAAARSDIESISSFSSQDSYTVSYKTKYQEECEKAKKLEQKLEGYKTVVSQLPKYQETITQLKRQKAENELVIARLTESNSECQREIEELKTCAQQQNTLLKRVEAGSDPQKDKARSTTPQDDTHGWTDLGTHHVRVSPTSNRSSATASSPSFVVIGRAHTPGELKVESPRRGAPVTEYNIREPCWPPDLPVPSSVSQRPEVRSQQPSLQRHLPNPLEEHQPLATSESAFSKRTQTLASRTIIEPSNPARVENIRSHTGLPTTLGKSQEALSTYSFAKGGPVGILAVGSVNVRPLRTMEQKATRQAAESAWGGDLGDPNPTAPLATRAEAKSTSSPQARHKVGGDVYTSPPPGHFQPVLSPHSTFGIGARPKERLPPNNKETAPAFSVGNTHKAEHKEHTPRDHFSNAPQRLLDTPSLEVIDTLKMGDETARSKENLAMNDLGVSTNLNVHAAETRPLVDISSLGDLMEFPSSSGSQKTERKADNATSNVIYNKQSGNVTYPTDDQSYLASRVENIAVILKTGSIPSGISDKMFQFASDAAKMEEKLVEYQSLTQKLQVQIQSEREELQKVREENCLIREENETLLSFVQALQAGQAFKGKPGEPNWAVVLSGQTSIAEMQETSVSDSSLIKKVETLESMNAKLFMANTEWYNKWEGLRQQTQAEKEDLEVHVRCLTTQIEKFKDEISTLDKDLSEANASREETISKNFELERSRLEQQQLIETLKTETEKLIRDKRRLETEITTLGNSSRQRVRDQTGHTELETQISLLKQQLSVFAEDFEKERQDRTAAENKAERFRKERDQIRLSLEAKVKTASLQLKSQEDELRKKARQNANLLYQVEELKLQLQREHRKTQNMLTHAPASISHGPATRVFYSNAGPRSNFTYGDPSYLPSIVNPIVTSLSRQLSPEHIPGAWRCRACTYINYPNKQQCEICDGPHTPNDDLISTAESNISGRPELHSRGEQAQDPGTNVPDVEVDGS